MIGERTFDRRYFVLAPSFHGSTLLAKLLNAHTQVVYLGDTYPTNGYDQVCGCGLHISACPFWRAVKEAVGAARYADCPDMLPNWPKLTGTALDGRLYANLPMAMLRRLVPAKAEIFRGDYEKFLAAVYAHRDATVFVDGVKSVARVRAMIASGGRVDGVLHVVRDAADYVKSALKNHGADAATLARNAWLWRTFHKRAAGLGRQVPYLRIDYGALCDRTDATLAEAFGFMGVAGADVAALRQNFGREWHFIGNASVLDFDGRIRQSHHAVTTREKAVIDLFAGRRI